MSRLVTRASWVLVAFTSPASAQTLSQLIPHQVTLESVDYLGKRAAKITKDGQVANGEAYAIVKDVSYRAWRATSAPHVSDPKATRSKNSWPSYAERRIMPHDGGESLDSLVDHFAPIDLQLLRANERARGARQA